MYNLELPIIKFGGLEPLFSVSGSIKTTEYCSN